MNTTVADSKSPHLLMWIAGIAVILFSVAGIAAIMGWIPTSLGRGNASVGIAAPGKLATKAGAPEHGRSQPAPLPVAQRGVASHSCADCGVIESTRAVKSKGEGTGIGAVGGAVAGGLIGNQIGAGRGNTVATVVGAVGGAVAGNEVEKRVKSTTAYEVTVRLDDGSSRVVNEGSASAWHAGDRVKIVSGEIQANP
ncbi:MAG: glycine zipper 2TM domain-containing protein [Betaproteobacteria bacterium]